MDFAERYRALSARDARFDGWFVAAVRTTGIYCRPSCPARTPKSSNVTFYATSAAAHQAGYRACRRCLPEATPGSPDWNVREDVAARAMRLIIDGVVERDGVVGLSSRLGYSTRQLNRVLVAELGAGALALARAHRAQTARQLLVSTDLPVAEVAFAAGFASIRQFNDTVREVFALTPTQVRATARASDARAAAPGRVRVRLAHREPIDVAGVLDWFAERSLPSVESSADGYARSTVVNERPATVRVCTSGTGLFADLVATSLGDLPVLLSRVRRLFDLDADPAAVDAVIASDQRFAPLVEEVPGIRIPGAIDAGEMLVRAMVGQQITVASARTQLTRLTGAFGVPLPPDLQIGGVTRLFPSMAVIAERGAEVLTGPRARIDAIRAAAGAVAAGDFDDDLAMTRHELINSLIGLRGVGPWTADYVAMRRLSHPDVLVRGDVAMAHGARRLGLDPRDLATHTAHCAPWRSYVSLHLWRAASRKDHPS